MKQTRVSARAAGLVLIASAAASSLAGAQQPHLDPSRPIEERVEYVISQLTLEEKASLMGTTAPAIERLNIPAMWGWNQSLHGVVWNQPTTMFPTNIGMAATWNPELIQEVASVIHDEARAINNLLRATPGRIVEGEGRQCCLVTDDGRELRLMGLVYRSPVINISRQPHWGRVLETYGEDPHLTSRMAVAYVRGMQGDHPRYLKVAATLKHFAMNNEEGGNDADGRPSRHYLDAQVPERWMHEYYLPHFKAGVVEANAQSIMSVYNKLNGVPGAANSWLMEELLVDRWGFNGFRVPDSGAIGRLVSTHAIVESEEEAAAVALKAGHDLDEGGIFPEYIPRAVQQGLITEAEVDEALRRVLTVRFRLGEFDPPEMVPYTQYGPEMIRAEEHQQLALETARQSIVLLTNRDDFLPLDRNSISSIAVIGPHADTAMTGIGYTGVTPPDFIKPIDGIRNKAAPGTEIRYAQGVGILDEGDIEAGIAEAVEVARNSDVAIVFVGTGREYEREGRDRKFLHLAPHQQQLVRRVLAAQPRTIVVQVNAGPLSLSGPSQVIDPPAVLAMFMAGEEGGDAVAEVIFGDYNPAGRLPYTVYRASTDVPGWDEFDISKGYTYMYFRGEPEWAFGHGLSYTTFDYSNARLSTNQLPGNGQVEVSVDVRNSGSRAGDEVVQLYVHDLQPRVVRPIKQLRGFERIHLEPGETRTVTFTLSAEDLSFYDENQHAFVVEPGPYEVMIGASSADIRQTVELSVTSGGRWDP